jgi:hypothetical protein
LGAFLELRARLFRDLYYNPGARFLEHTVASVVIRDLYETGILTRDRLLTMQDWELDHEIEERTGLHCITGMLSNREIIGRDNAFVEVFRTREAAERREDELERAGEYMVLNEEFVGATATGAKILTRKDGKALPFSEAYPERTELLENIMRNNTPYRVYYFPIARGFTPWFHEAMERYRARRRVTRRAAQEMQLG